MGREKVKERVVAEQMYCERFMTAKDIADTLQIEANTVGKWIHKYGWDKSRQDTINNPVKMRKLLAEQMLLVLQGQPANIDADALSKIYKVYEGISDKINPGMVAAILKLYDEWLVKKDPKLATDNLPYNKEFLIHIINTYG